MQQILEYKNANSEEKAFFLANFFIALDKKLQINSKIMVLYGKDQLSKNIHLVLRKETSHFEIWNPIDADLISF